jgi:hypothetical protein
LVTDNVEAFRRYEQAVQQLRLDKAGSRTEYVHSLLALAGSSDSSLSSFLASNPSAPSRTVVAAGLARLLKFDSGKFQDHNFSIESVRIFDSVFTDIYRRRNTQARDQTHVKQQAILDELNEATVPLAVYIGGALGEQHILEARTIVERYLRHSSASLLVLPLIPQPLRERGRLIELLRVFEESVSASERSLDDIELIRDALISDEYLMSEYGSSYYNEIIEPMLQTLFRAFENLVVGDPTFQPTSLELIFPDKRYALDKAQANLNLRAIVRNLGPGRASDVTIFYETTLSATGQKALNVAGLSRGDATFELPEVVEHAQSGDALLAAHVEWHDAAGHHRSKSYDEIILAQRGDVDWEQLRYSDPYSTEPVDSVGDLVGRSEQLDRMKNQFQGRVMPSYFVTGQKRVGKTSLVRTLCQILLDKDRGHDLHAIYLEGGDYIADDAPRTVKRLCNSIKVRIEDAFSLNALRVADDFGENLSDLASVFDQLWAVNPEVRVLLALDEFDELPFELFMKGAM